MGPGPPGHPPRFAFFKNFSINLLRRHFKLASLFLYYQQQQTLTGMDFLKVRGQKKWFSYLDALYVMFYVQLGACKIS